MFQVTTLSGVFIQHPFAIAVIRRNQQNAAGFRHRLFQAAEAAVDTFRRLDGSLQDPGVADHVAVGVIDDD